MRWIYDVGFGLFGLFSLPHFLLRLRQAEDPGRLVRERFGRFDPEAKARFQKRHCVWLHAVSVGEALAAEKLVMRILENYPGLQIVLTTVTPTGQRVAKAWEGDRLGVFYFPFDFRFSVSRFFDTVRPVCLVLVETEIWPNVIEEARRRGVPMVVVNGRLSGRSFRAFQTFSSLFRPLLRAIDRFFVQTESDRERLVALGVDSPKVEVTGNMKLDALDLNGKETGNRDALRRQWGFLPGDQVLVAGSTHRGEEEILLRAVSRLRTEGFALRLLLAPRHIERASKLLALAQRAGFRGVLSSQKRAGGPFDVLILNELGQLRNLYALADAVVMGGSLVPHGGQNPVEPAAAGRAILHGPWVFNFHDLYRRLDENGGSLKVSGEGELLFALKRVLGSDREREHLGRRAFEVLSQLRGATERNLIGIGPLLKTENGVKSEFA